MEYVNIHEFNYGGLIMSYKFIDDSGGYNYDLLSQEVEKFDSHDKFKYNETYITARKNIDWLNLDADISQKVQFLSDWNTTIVRANKSLYIEKFKEVAANNSLKGLLIKYKLIEISDLKFDNENISNDIKYIYEILDDILVPCNMISFV